MLSGPVSDNRSHASVYTISKKSLAVIFPSPIKGNLDGLPLIQATQGLIVDSLYLIPVVSPFQSKDMLRWFRCPSFL